MYASKQIDAIHWRFGSLICMAETDYKPWIISMDMHMITISRTGFVTYIANKLKNHYQTFIATIASAKYNWDYLWWFERICQIFCRKTSAKRVQNIEENSHGLSAQMRPVWIENGKGNQYSNEKYVFVMDRRGDFKKIYLIIPKVSQISHTWDSLTCYMNGIATFNARNGIHIYSGWSALLSLNFLSRAVPMVQLIK